jgi:hypothetical protein
MAGKKSTSRTPDVGPNKGGFVFGETEPGNQPNKILNLDKVDCFIAAYTDGESKKQVRLLFRVPNTQGVFVLQERIQGAFVATSATEWFRKAVIDRVDSETKAEDSDAAQV